MSDAIAVIPARGGSKRIPGKNIRNFAGQPALAWPIQAAQKAGIFARIIVSTDDAEIADVARSFGAEVPFTRSADLSDDHAGTTEVIRDAVTRLELSAETPVCCIYPTAFFVTPENLQHGLDILSGDATWVMSVGEYPTPIDRAYKIQNGVLLPRDLSSMPKRSQDLEPAYFDAGQFYWATANTWGTPGLHMWDGAKPVHLRFDQVVDVDTEDDWIRAEQIAELQHQRSM